MRTIPVIGGRVRAVFYERLRGGFRAGGTATMERMQTVQAQKIRTTVFYELHGF